MSRAASPGRTAAVRDNARTTSLDASGYFFRSAQPLTSLWFVLPMVVLYEAGTRWYTQQVGAGVEQRVIAFNLMRQFFAMCGARVHYLPCFAVVSILVAVHLMHRQKWTFEPMTLIGMLIESVLLAFPLLLAGQIVIHYMQHITLSGGFDARSCNAILTFLGAGVYEELVFRLAGFAILSLLFRDLLKLDKRLSTLLIVVCSGIAFSLYHYLGDERFLWTSFVFRTFAGIYFGVIFLTRGFGITSGTHAAYDIIVWSLR